MANILVCDDDKDIVEAIEIYLTQEGYCILKAYDGQEALDILNSETVDLLIIDVMMPRLDGIRATVRIRESNPLPIIILSAKSEDTDKILGLNIGADDYTEISAERQKLLRPRDAPGETVDHKLPSGLRERRQQFIRVRVGRIGLLLVADMHDRGQSPLQRKVEKPPEHLLLRLAVGLLIIIIQPQFSDRDEFFMPPELAELLWLGQKFVRLVRMHTD